MASRLRSPSSSGSASSPRLMAALIALAQSDIKRILAYSTVSQLGLMMVSLGVGGVAAGIMHLLAHGFFKALLFLGAGSVIHGLSSRTGHSQNGRLAPASCRSRFSLTPSA